MENDTLKSLVQEERARKEATGETILIPNPFDDSDRLGVKQELYNTYAGEYERRTESGLILFERELRLFRDLTPDLRVIDLGSGPGRDANYLSHLGLHPLCCDFSIEMLRRCEDRCLETRLMNYETDLELFEDNSLGGLWTNCSLTTTPQSKIRDILREIYRILMPGAPAYFGFIEAKDYAEGWVNPDFKYSLPRFRFRANRAYIKRLIEEQGFDVIHFDVIPKETSGKNTYVKYVCLKPYSR